MRKGTKRQLMGVKNLFMIDNTIIVTKTENGKIEVGQKHNGKPAIVMFPKRG